jgi:hypothetical protein
MEVLPHPGAAPGGRRYAAIILTEDGDDVSGSASDADDPRTDRAEHFGAGRSEPRVRRHRGDTGPVLPDVTSDERDVGWGEVPEPDGDERLLREVPPHHGS